MALAPVVLERPPSPEAVDGVFLLDGSVKGESGESDPLTGMLS